MQNSENCCSCTDFEVEKLNEGEKFELLKKINDHLGAPGPNLQKMFGTEIVGTFPFLYGLGDGLFFAARNVLHYEF